MRYPNRSNIPQDFQHEAALNNVPFRQLIGLSGFASLPTAGTAYTMWPASPAYTHQITPSTVSVVAGGLGDSFLGTGARTVRLDGLGPTGQPLSETVNMNGGAGVTTTNEFFAVNCMTVLTAGASGTNETLLTATHTATSNPANYIRAGASLSSSAVYRVPANMRATIKTIRATGFLSGNTNPITSCRAVRTTSVTGSRVATTCFEMQGFGVQTPFDAGLGIVIEPLESVFITLTPSANSVTGTVFMTLILGDAR